MVDSAVFIGAAIIAVTQFIKEAFRAGDVNVSGAVTIGVAVVLGWLVGVFDTHIGIADISVAQGILTALGAVGVHSVATKIG